MTARRFEFRDAKSAKFWEIEAVEHRTITTWGRLGTDGQTRAKEFASAAKATADADKKVAEKLKKGYTETGEVVGATAPPAPATHSTAPTAAAQPVIKAAASVSASEPQSAEQPAAGAPSPAADSAAIGATFGADVEPDPEPAFAELTMSSAWQKKVLPRRDVPNMLFPLWPKPDPEAAAQTMANKIENRREWLQKHVSAGTLDSEVVALMFQRAEHLDQNNPLHVSSTSLAVRILGLDFRTFGDYAHHIVDHWVAGNGFEFALRVVNDANWWRLPDEWDHATRTRSETFSRAVGQTFLARGIAPLIQRLRHHLALADEPTYLAALATADELVAGGGFTDWRMAFLFPDQLELVNTCLAHATATGYQNASLLPMVGTTEHLEAILRATSRIPNMNRWSAVAMPTLLATLGADLIPYLAAWLKGNVLDGGPSDSDVDADSRRAHVQALQFLGNDDAFQALAGMADDKHVLPGLTQLAHERPHAAVRALASRSRGTGAQANTITALLRSVVREHTGAVMAVFPALSEQDRARVEELGDRSDEKPTAPAELVHALLVDPPWKNRVESSDRHVVMGLKQIVIEPRLNHPPATGLSARAVRSADPELDWNEVARSILAGHNPANRGNSYTPHGNVTWFFDAAPLDVVQSMLPKWQPPTDASNWVLGRVASVLFRRLGTDAVPTLERLAGMSLSSVIDQVEGLASPGLAIFFAEGFERTKSLRARAAKWLDQNADMAAYGLIPHAVGDDCAQQLWAANAIRYLARTNHLELVEKAAHEYGPDAQAAVSEVLAFDELQVLPKRMPKPPAYLSLATLPLPLLADRQHQLSAEAAGNLLTMLAISKPGEPYPGLGIVVPTLDPASTATFGWALFEAWRAAGMPSKHGWILAALGHLGDDDTVRQLTPVIRAWPGEGGHKRAVNGLDALADIGTDLALMQLFGMSRKLKFKGLKNKAAEKVEQIAEQRDMTADQLADRLVPDLDLDANGSLLLDYGSRTFTVGFDEQLKPYVRDDTGKIRKVLPKPGQKDDAELAPLAYKQFSALKKDARAVAADQLVRLEQAMVRQRRWSSADFSEYFVDHPLIIHLVRRLIWGVYEDDALVTSFRVAEDRSLANANDDEYPLDPAATVGIAHPLDFAADELAAWGEVLSDYEMLQPFQQAARETFAMTPDELASNLFTRFNGPLLPFGKYLGLEKRGWIRGTPQDGGVSPNLYRPLPDGKAIQLELEEGLWTGYIQETPDQPIRGVWIGDANSSWYSKNNEVAFSTLSPIVVSELLRDMVDLFG